jgi:hypothetical protein
MPTLVSRNTIQLAAGASAVDDYYNGYWIEFARLDKLTGKKTVQKFEIIDYSGSTKVATIGGLWDENIVPGAETSTKKDSYKIVPKYKDSRVSINPAIQAMDYITSERYGRSLDPIIDLDLPSWLEAGRACDKRSDVTIELTGGTMPTVGDVYRYPATGDILWQGKVQTVTNPYVRFTDIIGKLTNKWNSWKSYPLNAIVYNETRLYLVTAAGVKTTSPTHTSGTTNGLQYINAAWTLTKVSGAGPATIPPIFSANPIRVKKNGVVTSGYSLYDADGIDYWRYIGWDGHDQRYVTQHQTNLTIDTSLPLFDNMNSLLEHFGGMLRYQRGKYYLEIEEAETGIQTTNDPRYITTNDIISKIRITDEGIRSSFNSLTVAFADPANKFEARNISFFNSEYLKADRNVSKKGTLSIPGITSYYNARLLADRYLSKSRYNLTVSFNMSPKGALLVPGRVIQIPYARYGWTNKQFRITDITHNTDTSVDIVAEEYDDSFYVLKPVSKPPAVGLAGSAQQTSVGNPTSLIATSNTNNNEGSAGIELTWDNASGVTPDYTVTEVHVSYSPNYIVTVNNISTNTLTATAAHGLTVGMTITSDVELNGLIKDGKYYVVEVPSTTTFKLAYEKNGTPINFTSGPGTFPFRTATIIANVPVPENSYFDPYVGGDADRIQKYYWVRHKVNG